MLPLIVLSCFSTRLCYLQYYIYLTFPLRATLARNEKNRATNGNNIAHLCRYLQNSCFVFVKLFLQEMLRYGLSTVNCVYKRRKTHCQYERVKRREL